MPIYEYECGACGSGFEELQLGREAPTPSCPSCRSDAEVRRRISASSFVLKGGGWYRDLYASPKAEANKGKEGSSEKAPSKASGSTEAA